MNVNMRAIRASLVVIGLLILAGCGGSGSSGFEGVSSVSQAIAQAIDGDQCVMFEEQTFCASGAEAETEEFRGASVVIKAPDEPLLCDDETPGLACTGSLDFTTEGFTVVNSLLAAVSASEEGPWTLVPLHASEDALGPHRVTILVPGEPNATTPKPFIAAVLVYAGVPPEELPDSAPNLSDFGVALVYVSRRLEIVVPVAPVERRALVEYEPPLD